MAELTAAQHETHDRLGVTEVPVLELVSPSAGRSAASAASGPPTSLQGSRTLTEIAARAAGRAPGVASMVESTRGLGIARERSCGVVAVRSPDGRQDLRVSVRAYLGDFLELGWAVRDAIRSAAAAHGLEREIGLIDVEIVALVLPIEEMPSA